MIKLNRSAGIPARYANRHGLITGATGTGKTVSLMRLVEQFSHAGVPAFVADVKGDIAALTRSCPTTQLDLFGHSGQPIRVTFKAMGADLVARSLELTDAQSGVVEVAFAYAADNRLPLDTLADFRALLGQLHAKAKDISAVYGQVGAASIAVVQRALMRLESQGGRQMFAAPAFDVADLLEVKGEFEETGARTGANIGRGLVSILKADRLMQSPRLYGAFLPWMLSDLYERLPEVGDLDKPRLVFFFDEAHLLFQDCAPALLRRIEQTVRLIRSKGVGVYFVSQSPSDVPTLIREQLAHRIEHDRALPVGTARVSTMTADGKPTPSALIKVELPECPLGALEPAEMPWQPVEQAAPVNQSPRLLIALCIAVALAIASGVYWLAATDRMGVAVAALLVLLFVYRRRGR